MSERKEKMMIDIIYVIVLELISPIIDTCMCFTLKSFVKKNRAARNGHLNVVEYLVTTCKVNIDATTSDGTTA